MSDYSDDIAAAGLRMRWGPGRVVLLCGGALALVFAVAIALMWAGHEYPARDSGLDRLTPPEAATASRVPSPAPVAGIVPQAPRLAPRRPVTTESQREKLRAQLLGGPAAPRRAKPPPRRDDPERLTLERLYGSELKKERRLSDDVLFGEHAGSLAAMDSAFVGREGLSSELIEAVIADNRGAMSLCAAEAVRRGELVASKLEVELTIRPEGRVSNARIATKRHRDSALGNCVVRRALGWRFPAFEGRSVTVAYPYVFGG